MLHRTIVLITLLAVLAGCSACAPQSTPDRSAGVRPPAGGTPAPAPTVGGTIFTENFDGPLNTSMWKPYHSTYGDGNNELQCHTPNNTATAGGVLNITARRETVTCPGGSVRNFTAGFLGTRETGHYFPLFGRYEMRARLPHGQSLWPAFWLRHRKGAGVAEVDIMEYFHATAPGQSTGTLHLDGVKNISKRSQHFETPTADPGWHTWGVDITLDPAGIRFTFRLDGTAYHSYVDTKHAWAGKADANATWDMALNMSVGGDYLGHPDGQLGVLGNGRCGRPWGAAPPCNTTGMRRADFPSTYQVDWVRVSKLQ